MFKLAQSTYRTIANQAFAASQNSIVVPLPAGVVDGDLLITILVVQSGTARTITTLSGWTLVRSDSVNAGQVVLATYQKIASSEPSTYTWSLSGTADQSAGAAVRVDTFDPTAPIDTSNGAGTSGGNTNSLVFTDTVTPTLANELILFPIFAFASGHQNLSGMSAYAVTTSNPSWTEVLDILGNILVTTGQLNFAIAYANRAQTTATGNSSATDTGGIGPNNYIAQKIVVKNQTAFSSTLTDTVVDTDSMTGFTTTSSVVSDTVVDTDSVATAKSRTWTQDQKNNSTWTQDQKS